MYTAVDGLYAMHDWCGCNSFFLFCVIYMMCAMFVLCMLWTICTRCMMHMSGTIRIVCPSSRGARYVAKIMVQLEGPRNAAPCA